MPFTLTHVKMSNYAGLLEVAKLFGEMHEL